MMMRVTMIMMAEVVMRIMKKSGRRVDDYDKVRKNDCHDADKYDDDDDDGNENDCEGDDEENEGKVRK